MSNDREQRDERQEQPGDTSSQGERKSRGNSLKDASDEMVKFIEDADEPGHAGRGDVG